VFCGLRLRPTSPPFVKILDIDAGLVRRAIGHMRSVLKPSMSMSKHAAHTLVDSLDAGAGTAPWLPTQNSVALQAINGGFRVVGQRSRITGRPHRRQPTCLAKKKHRAWVVTRARRPSPAHIGLQHIQGPCDLAVPSAIVSPSPRFSARPTAVPEPFSVCERGLPSLTARARIQCGVGLESHRRPSSSRSRGTCLHRPPGIQTSIQGFLRRKNPYP